MLPECDSADIVTRMPSLLLVEDWGQVRLAVHDLFDVYGTSCGLVASIVQ
jgi:hypothetical protein